MLASRARCHMFFFSKMPQSLNHVCFSTDSRLHYVEIAKLLYVGCRDGSSIPFILLVISMNCFFFFLVADTQLFKRLCLSTCRSVRRLVGPSIGWSICWLVRLLVSLSVGWSVHLTVCPYVSPSRKAEKRAFYNLFEHVSVLEWGLGGALGVNGCWPPLPTCPQCYCDHT